MFCSKCSAKQNIEDIYCPNCGALIELPEESQLQDPHDVTGTNEQSKMSAGDRYESALIPGIKPGSIWGKVLSAVFVVILITLIVAILTTTNLTTLVNASL